MPDWLLPPVRPLCFCAGVKAGILTGSTLSSMKEGLSGPGVCPETPLFFLKSYLEFCSVCSRTVFLDA